MPATPMAEYPTGLVQLAPNLYGYLQYNGGWGYSNAGFLVGKNDVVVFDTLMYPSMMRPFLQALNGVTTKPVSYVVNTHSHGDHTNGNQYFQKSAILAQVNCREQMLAQAKALAARAGARPRPAWMTEQQHRELGDIVLTPPTVTFSDRLVFYQDDTEIQLLHYGPAHTTGDCVIFLPQFELALLGDLGFLYCTPLVAGSVVNFILSIDKILQLDVSRLVSGHGPIAGKEAIKESREYLEFVLEEARKGIKAGLPSAEAAKRVKLGAFAQWTESERLPGNMAIAYKDLGVTT